MEKCDSCGHSASGGARFHHCAACRPVFTGMYAALNPGKYMRIVHAHSKRRREAFSHSLRMARHLCATAMRIASSHETDESLRATLSQVEELWALGKEARGDVLN